MFKLDADRADALLLDIEAAAEPLDLTGSVDKPLRSCVERVALGAEVDLQLLAGGLGLECISAGANDGRVNVLRMNSLFHRSIPFVDWRCGVRGSE